jgi:RNA-directed DNA polymerase
MARADRHPLVAFELTRLTTYAPAESPRYRLPRWSARAADWKITDYKFKGFGYLPQGAPTSPMLSNLIMREIDAEIEKVATTIGLTYTRYSDDLTFSTRGPDFNWASAGNLVGKVTRILLRVGLFPQHHKTAVIAPGARKVVLGLVVDGRTPRLAREFRANLRQHIYYLEKFGPIEHAKSRQFDSLFGMYNHIRGLIDFARMVDRPYADAVLSRFNGLNWPFEFDPPSALAVAQVPKAGLGTVVRTARRAPFDRLTRGNHWRLLGFSAIRVD